MICRRAFPLPVALGLALTSCQRGSDPTAGKPEFIQLESDRLSLVQRAELLSMRYERLASPYEEAVTLSTRLESQRATLRTLRERKRELESDVLALGERKDALRHEALRVARERAVGKQLPELTLADGRTFRQATITGASEAGIQIRHATGTARLDVNDLGPARGELYGLDPELHAKAMAREETERLAYEQWIDRELSKQAAANTPAKPVREQAVAKSDPVSVSTNASATPFSSGNARSSALREKPRYFGGVKSRPRYVYYYYYRPYGAPVFTPRDTSASFSSPDSSQ